MDEKSIKIPSSATRLKSPTGCRVIRGTGSTTSLIVYFLIEYPQLLIFVGEIWHKSPILGWLNHVLVVC